MATVSLTAKISIPKHVLVRVFQNESVLLNLDSEFYHGLDDVGTHMWQAVTQSKTIQDAYDLLQSEFEVDPATLKKDLNDFIERLVQRGLVEIHER
ncbi:MAG: PqqD family protein [Desulfobaccales bacterium]